MTIPKTVLTIGLLCGLIHTAAADTHYVAITSTNPVSPFITWETAATNIQDAIDVSVSNDTVLVSHGVYATGGRVIYGAMTNRVAITNAITVQSVNGPDVTIIMGAKDPLSTNGDAAVRCAYVGTNATLSGFTLTSGATRAQGDAVNEQRGGGAWCATNATVDNCVLAGNSAYSSGGGVCFGTLNNCILSGNISVNLGGGSYYAALNNCTLWDNSANYGGGSYYGTLNNCTLIGNSAKYNGGGAYKGAQNNCIVYYNTASQDGANRYQGEQTFCCTTPMSDGMGNITNEPLVASRFSPHLMAGSPCIDAGNNAYASGTDMDGAPRIAGGAVDIGCDESTSPITGVLAVAIRAAWTNFAVGFAEPFEAVVSGIPSGLVWSWGDSSASTNRCMESHTYEEPGTYDVVLMVS